MDAKDDMRAPKHPSMSLLEAIVVGWALVTAVVSLYLLIHGAPAVWEHMWYPIFFVTWIPIMVYRSIRYLTGK